MNPTEIVPGYTRLTSSFYYEVDISPFEQLVFEGKQMFDGTDAILALSFDEEGTSWDQSFVFVADWARCRIIATSRHDYVPDANWCHARGGPGTGPLQFYHPAGLAYVGQHWFVADFFNSRVQVYNVYWADDTWTHRMTVADDFDGVGDVDAVRIPSASGPSSDVFEMAVIDYGNGEVEIYDLDLVGSPTATHRRTLFGRGEGFGQLTSPQSVCYYRNKIDHYPMSYICVSDAGNNKLIMANTKYYQSPTETPPGMFPANAFLTDLTIDYYGNVYVVDTDNDCIYVVSPNLQELVAVFGEKGTGDRQLFHPKYITKMDCWRYNGTERYEPVVVGEMLTTEFFTEDTGIRSWVLGSEVLWSQCRYTPQPVPGYWDVVRCDWHQTNTTNTTRWVYLNDSLVYQAGPAMNLPGGHYELYYLEPEDPDTFWMKFVVRTESVYGTTDTTFVDSILVERRVQCCEGIRGNVNGDPADVINGSDVTYLISYLYSGGAAPPCREEGNVDGDPDERIDIVDLVFLLAYMFSGGMAPPACPY